MRWESPVTFHFLRWDYSASPISKILDGQHLHQYAMYIPAKERYSFLVCHQRTVLEPADCPPCVVMMMFLLSLYIQLPLLSSSSSFLSFIKVTSSLLRWKSSWNGGQAEAKVCSSQKGSEIRSSNSSKNNWHTGHACLMSDLCFLQRVLFWCFLGKRLSYFLPFPSFSRQIWVGGQRRRNRENEWVSSTSFLMK